MAYIDKSKSDDWSTPLGYWNALNESFRFDLDAAASQHNHLCEKWIGLDHPDPARRDGLTAKWDGKEVWVNPPYGRIIGDWIIKAHQESEHRNITMLLPSRTDTQWFHSLLNKEHITVEFLKGRLKFGNGSTPAPFASILVRFQR